MYISDRYLIDFYRTRSDIASDEMSLRGQGTVGSFIPSNVVSISLGYSINIGGISLLS